MVVGTRPKILHGNHRSFLDPFVREYGSFKVLAGDFFTVGGRGGGRVILSVILVFFRVSVAHLHHVSIQKSRKAVIGSSFL